MENPEFSTRIYMVKMASYGSFPIPVAGLVAGKPFVKICDNQ